MSIHIVNVNHDLIRDYGYYIHLELSCSLAFPLRPWLNRARRPSSMISAQKSNDEETVRKEQSYIVLFLPEIPGAIPGRRT